MSNKSIYRSIPETISGEDRVSVAVLGSERGGRTVSCDPTRMACELATHDRRVSRGWFRAPGRRRGT